MNELPKIVFSRTLEKVDWKNSRLVKKNIATFMRLGLIDEYRIMVNPDVLGSGRPMFKNVKDRTTLKLKRTEKLRSGVITLYYQPA